MRILRNLPECAEVGPMPMWQRWLCGLLLVVTTPLWLPALLAISALLAARSLLTKRREN